MNTHASINVTNIFVTYIHDSHLFCLVTTGVNNICAGQDGQKVSNIVDKY